jgi:hypothetical protein
VTVFGQFFVINISNLFIYKRGYSQDITPFQLCSALNPDSSIRMNCCDSPWFFAIWAFCFVEDTFPCQQNLIANFVIIVHLLAIFGCRAKIGLTLPVITNFVPVGYERNVEEHVAPKYCRTWRGLEDCMIGRVNGPCCVVKEDIDVIRGYCLGHIKFGCV